VKVNGHALLNPSPTIASEKSTAGNKRKTVTKTRARVECTRGNLKWVIHVDTHGGHGGGKIKIVKGVETFESSTSSSDEPPRQALATESQHIASQDLIDLASAQILRRKESRIEGHQLTAKPEENSVNRSSNQRRSTHCPSTPASSLLSTGPPTPQTSTSQDDTLFDSGHLPETNLEGDDLRRQSMLIDERSVCSNYSILEWSCDELDHSTLLKTKSTNKTHALETSSRIREQFLRPIAKVDNSSFQSSAPQARSHTTNKDSFAKHRKKKTAETTLSDDCNWRGQPTDDSFSVKEIVDCLEVPPSTTRHLLDDIEAPELSFSAEALLELSGPLDDTPQHDQRRNKFRAKKSSGRRKKQTREASWNGSGSLSSLPEGHEISNIEMDGWTEPRSQDSTADMSIRPSKENSRPRDSPKSFVEIQIRPLKRPSMIGVAPLQRSQLTSTSKPEIRVSDSRFKRTPTLGLSRRETISRAPHRSVSAGSISSRSSQKLWLTNGCSRISSKWTGKTNMNKSLPNLSHEITHDRMFSSISCSDIKGLQIGTLENTLNSVSSSESSTSYSWFCPNRYHTERSPAINPYEVPDQIMDRSVSTQFMQLNFTTADGFQEMANEEVESTTEDQEDEILSDDGSIELIEVINRAAERRDSLPRKPTRQNSSDLDDEHRSGPESRRSGQRGNTHGAATLASNAIVVSPTKSRRGFGSLLRSKSSDFSAIWKAPKTPTKSKSMSVGKGDSKFKQFLSFANQSFGSSRAGELLEDDEHSK
jgi:hypothetical protein